LKESDIAAKLLGRINGVTLVPLQENKFCCGAAGDYMIMHKKMATTLRAAKLSEISQLKLDLLVTTNVGCALHLRKGLHTENQAVTVVHPISVIAELLTKQ
jgi:glycolate oxidase iron-sulfur subunit